MMNSVRVVLLLTIVTTHLLKFKLIRQLLSTAPSEELLRLVAWFLSQQKHRKLSEVASFLMTE